jgi:hypothetical protein
MSPVPPASPAAPLLATALLVILLTITALSVRLCLATGSRSRPPMATEDVASPDAFASSMATFAGARR